MNGMNTGQLRHMGTASVYSDGIVDGDGLGNRDGMSSIDGDDGFSNL